MALGLRVWGRGFPFHKIGRILVEGLNLDKLKHKESTFSSQVFPHPILKLAGLLKKCWNCTIPLPNANNGVGIEGPVVWSILGTGPCLLKKFPDCWPWFYHGMMLSHLFTLTPNPASRSVLEHSLVLQLHCKHPVHKMSDFYHKLGTQLNLVVVLKNNVKIQRQIVLFN